MLQACAFAIQAPMSSSVRLAWLLSMAAWLVPILVLQIVRSRRDRPLWEIALDIPFGVALDLLSILAATRFVHLETAALASRPAWAIGAAAIATYRWRHHGWRPRWPTALGARDLLAALAAGALAVTCYSGISFHYDVWDYGLHIPTVTAIASQPLPFVNPLSGTQVLHYHFAGDVLASVVRTLSFDVISSMRALHTGHDLMIAAIASTVALLSMGLGLRRRWSALLGGLAVVLQGPIPLRGGLGHAFLGYSYHNFASLSYRPHAPLAALMLVGALGVLACRAVRRASARTYAAAPLLLATIAVLSISDEASAAQFGLALGVAWLVEPRLLAPRRVVGLVLLVGMGVAIADANLVFSASLAPGSPVQTVTLTTAARVPPVLGDVALPLSEPHGWMVLVMDFLPLLACGTALAWLAVRERTRPLVALAVLVWTSIAVSACLLLHLEVNHAHNESQRYVVAPFFACVVLAVLFLDRMPRGSVMASLALLGIAAPAMFTVYWIHELAASAMSEFSEEATPAGERLHDLDCRSVADAHFGERPRVAYVESTEYYRVATCRPIFQSSGPKDWAIPVKPTIEAKEQLRNLDANLVAPSDELDAICLRDPKAKSDDVCKRALHVRTSCRPFGARYLVCPLTPSDRDTLLGY